MIAEGGLELLAEGGLDNLSTRKLAAHFGIKSASLYHHFRNKQELLDLVADVMIRPALVPAEGGQSWQQWLAALALQLRRRVLAYPDGALLYAGASPPQENYDERLALLFGPLQQAGLPQDMARRVILSVLRFTIGWTVDEQVAHGRGADRNAETSESDFAFGVQTFILGTEALVARARG
jgi:TetR/AcrR family tetracycline transcriptional repressor